MIFNKQLKNILLVDNKILMVDNTYIKFGEIILYNPSKYGTDFFPGYEGNFDDFNKKLKNILLYLQTIPKAVPEYLERNLVLRKTLKDFRRSLRNSGQSYIFSYCYSAPDPSQGIILIGEDPNIVFVREKKLLYQNDKNDYNNYVIVYGKKRPFFSWIRMSSEDRKNYIEKCRNKYYKYKLLPYPIATTIIYE